MPELPEVETVMRGLAARLEGRRLRHVRVNRHDLRRAVPAQFAAALTGARVIGFRRRGQIHIDAAGYRAIGAVASGHVRPHVHHRAGFAAGGA